MTHLKVVLKFLLVQLVSSLHLLQLLLQNLQAEKIMYLPSADNNIYFTTNSQQIHKQAQSINQYFSYSHENQITS